MTRPASRAAAALALLAASCTVGPDYEPPQIEVPDAWLTALQGDVAAGGADLQRWWRVFGDPALEALIERAAAGNLDLRIAYERVREVQALRGVAAAARWPDVQGFGVAELREASSRTPPIGVGTATANSYGIGLDASWEIDVWGRITRLIESAEAEVQAEVEAYRDVLVVLLAQVAVEYVDHRALVRRIAIAEANVLLQQETLQLTQDRLRAGLVSELDVRQAELNLERTRAAIPPLRTGAARAAYRLAVLVGENPGAVAELLGSGDPLAATAAGQLPARGPIDALRRRPDVRRAERALAAQTARIGVAEAELYPRFSLFGSFALAGIDGSARDFFDVDATAWSFGPNFRWNLFNAGRVRSDIEAERARADQVLAAYRQTVLLALEEVEGALVAYAQEIDRRAALQNSVVASQRSVELVTELYRTGQVDFQNVLDMQRSLAAQQDALAESEGLVSQSLVLLYRALGGGWDPGDAVVEGSADAGAGDGPPKV
jgi:NodT family efflux transporter outer membrane factor (OMF) lipoprotein